MGLNDMIDVSRKFEPTKVQQSIQQDNASKAAFALDMMQRMPQEPPPPEDPPKIPSLGALAIPN